MRVCSFAASVVRVTVSWDLAGSRDSTVTDLSAVASSLNCAGTWVPVGASNVDVRAAYAPMSGADPSVTIFHELFAEPVEKCYFVTEAGWDELTCSEGVQCPPY